MEHADSVRVQELSRRIGVILGKVRDLMKEREELLGTLQRTELALSEARQSANEASETARKLELLTLERESIRKAVDSMLGKIDELEVDLKREGRS